jgi:hypothetical protein
MEMKSSKLVLSLMMLALLLVLAVGPMVPGLAVQMAESRAGAVGAGGGLNGLLACPYSGGGGGTGGG